VTAERDLLVIGGGIVGLSLAVHAARLGLATTLVEAGPLGGASTQRSGALLRAHYQDESSARLAKRGLEHFAAFPELYGGEAGYRETGFAYVPTEEEVESGALARRVAMLRNLVGVETELLDGEALWALEPELDVADVGIVAYEPGAGYADPAATAETLAGAAAAVGAELRERTRVERLLPTQGPGVAGAELAGGEAIAARDTVLCAGAWSVPLARGVGLELPILPTAVKLAFFERRVASHLTVIDAPGGIYLRTMGADATLVGRRTWTDQPLAGPDAELPEVDARFVDDARGRLEQRLPSAAGAACLGGRAGMLDMTPDGLPLVGTAPIDGLWLCCGWSGTGFKTGPAVGEALAAWIAGGERPDELARFAPDRDLALAAGVRSPN
jgi:sarcosine oxidase subunit beta